MVGRARDERRRGDGARARPLPGRTRPAAAPGRLALRARREAAGRPRRVSRPDGDRPRRGGDARALLHPTLAGARHRRGAARRAAGAGRRPHRRAGPGRRAARAGPRARRHPRRGLSVLRGAAAALAAVALATCGVAAAGRADDGTTTTATTTIAPPVTTVAPPVTTVAPPPPPPPPPVVTGRLPAWRAPGALTTIAGHAAPRARVVLFARALRLAATQAGTGGRFAIRFRAPAPGRYPLTVAASGLRAPAGVLRTRRVVLDAVGDITFGEQVGPALARHGAAAPWTAVGPTLRSADATIGNLETSVSLRGSAAVKQYTFRGPPWTLPPLRSVAGFDVLTLANN